jgi:hypothetical protein
MRDRDESERIRLYAESDVEDADRRMHFDPERFREQKAAAMKILETLRRNEEEQRHSSDLILSPKAILDDLTQELFCIIRHVVPHRSALVPDGVSDKRIHADAVSPILRTFSSVDNLIPKRIHSRTGTVQAASRQRLKLYLGRLERQSETDADIWRDGREAKDRRALIWRCRMMLFVWDSRFPAILFNNR